MVERAIKLDGTCMYSPVHRLYARIDNDNIPSTGTGEHGVGIGKREYLYKELGEGTVELMRSVKKTIDPLNLFNPGKVRQRSITLLDFDANIGQSVISGQDRSKIEMTIYFRLD